MLRRPHVIASALLLSLGSMMMSAHAESAPAINGETLKKVRDRGELICGVNPFRHGFASIDSKGKWQGLDVDFCRALAAAVLGDASKVRFTSLSTGQRFLAVQSGEVDVLSRNTSINLTSDVSLGISFAPPNFYTGVGFMVRSNTGAKKIEDLDGATICMTPSETERTVAQLFASRNLHYTPLVIENSKEYIAAYMTGRCDVIARGKVALPGMLVFDTDKPEDHTILPGMYSKDPMAMAVRKGDNQWYDIVKWVVYATFDAEELNVNQNNVDTELKSQNPDVQGLLGVNGNFGQKLGLDNKWAYNIVKQVGNYGDIYNRYFGPQSDEPMERDMNNLWTKGGLLYGMPIR